MDLSAEQRKKFSIKAKQVANILSDFDLEFSQEEITRFLMLLEAIRILEQDLWNPYPR